MLTQASLSEAEKAEKNAEKNIDSLSLSPGNLSCEKLDDPLKQEMKTSHLTENDHEKNKEAKTEAENSITEKTEKIEEEVKYDEIINQTNTKQEIDADKSFCTQQQENNQSTEICDSVNKVEPICHTEKKTETDETETAQITEKNLESTVLPKAEKTGVSTVEDVKIESQVLAKAEKTESQSPAETEETEIQLASQSEKTGIQLTETEKNDLHINTEAEKTESQLPAETEIHLASQSEKTGVQLTESEKNDLHMHTEAEQTEILLIETEKPLATETHHATDSEKAIADFTKAEASTENEKSETKLLLEAKKAELTTEKSLPISNVPKTEINETQLPK